MFTYPNGRSYTNIQLKELPEFDIVGSFIGVITKILNCTTFLCVIERNGTLEKHMCTMHKCRGVTIDDVMNNDSIDPSKSKMLIRRNKRYLAERTENKMITLHSYGMNFEGDLECDVDIDGVKLRDMLIQDNIVCPENSDFDEFISCADIHKSEETTTKGVDEEAGNNSSDSDYTDSSEDDGKGVYPQKKSQNNSGIEMITVI